MKTILISTGIQLVLVSTILVRKINFCPRTANQLLETIRHICILMLWIVSIFFTRAQYSTLEEVGKPTSLESFVSAYAVCNWSHICALVYRPCAQLERFSSPLDQTLSCGNI